MNLSACLGGVSFDQAAFGRDLSKNSIGPASHYKHGLEGPRNDRTVTVRVRAFLNATVCNDGNVNRCLERVEAAKLYHNAEPDTICAVCPNMYISIDQFACNLTNLNPSGVAGRCEEPGHSSLPKLASSGKSRGCGIPRD
jgi:hypothetical protein